MDNFLILNVSECKYLDTIKRTVIWTLKDRGEKFTLILMS